jgi:beta-glucosidase
MDRKWMEENKDGYTEKAKQILSQMNLEEKVALMSGSTGLLKLVIDGVIVRHYNKVPITAGGNARLKVPQLKFCDGPRGVVSGNSTCFPVSMQRGASLCRL